MNSLLDFTYNRTLYVKLLRQEMPPQDKDNSINTTTKTTTTSTTTINETISSPTPTPGSKENKLGHGLAHPLVVALCAAFGAGLTNLGVELYKNRPKDEAKFVYISSLITSNGGSIVLHNVGGKPGIITKFTFESNPKKEQVLSNSFFSTDTASDYKLRKNEYQQTSVLVCPPQKLCEVMYEGLNLSTALSPDILYIHDGKRNKDGSFIWTPLNKGNYQ
ncbi:hypothetical protein ACEWBL_23110 [Vibrio parahaemolyticus]